MKIGIIGLKPRQVSQLKLAPYDRLRVECMPSDGMTPAKCAAFAKKFDRVLILAPAVTTPVVKALKDMHCTLVPGNSTSIVAALLHTINKDATPSEVAEHLDFSEFGLGQPPVALSSCVPDSPEMQQAAHKAAAEHYKEDTTRTVTSEEREFIAQIQNEHPAEEPVAYHPEEREFWRQTYLAKIALSSGNSIASRLADEALAEHRKRFKL